MTAALLLICALTLPGCGRKGPLEPPPGAATLTGSGTPAAATDPAGAPVAAPDRPFFLDPLIR